MPSQSQYQIADTQTERQAETDECPSCEGVMLRVSDEFTCLERCLSCDHSRLLGWFSSSGLLVPGRASATRRAGEWAWQPAAQGA
jgi:hypothetical protein